MSGVMLPDPRLSPTVPATDPDVTASRPLRVALVNMPWARVNAPSIQCGLLQSVARRSGHDCDTHYLNVELAALLGGPGYDMIAKMDSPRLHLLGEWLFSYAAFGEVTSDAEYLAEYPELNQAWSEMERQGLPDLVTMRRETLPRWIAACAARPEWAEYDVIGFSSTFMQNTASLALGKAIKDTWPGVTLVYGGANFDGEMGAEYARTLPWLDHVVVGEGDVTFPALLRNIADGRATPLPGVHRYGDSNHAAASDSRRPTVLDELPQPDYGDYFSALKRFDRGKVLAQDSVRLPIEFSRGCWWGQKHHCTFCGLNALGMTFRAKSAARAMDELSALLREYPAVHIEAVDNILDMKYVSSLCAELAERHWDVNIFFEVKANLTREQLATMSRAGILGIQPGIESLSTNVLRLMRKGSSKLINIRLLKWARYYGIRVSWNVLAGFPGETDDDYAEQLRLIPFLYHLQPPADCGRIWLERFSPYYTDASFPITDVRPKESYRHVYPDSLDHAKIAYFFDYQASDTCSDEMVTAMRDAIGVWNQRFATSRPSLIYQRLPGRLTLVDRRTDEARRLTLTGWRAEAYDACGDAPRGAATVQQHITALGHEVGIDRVTRFLDECCRTGIAVSDEGKYLGLALPENPGW
jgi:ribosomal peptide maturation radical SAM protein 1